MQMTQRKRPTIGLLAGWQAYSGTLHRFLDYVFRGVRAAARLRDCTLLIGCGVNTPFSQTVDGRPAWPINLPGVDYVPIGPWNTDGLVIASPLSEQGNTYFHRLFEQGFPIVFAGDHLEGPSVTVDNEGGIMQAVAHLAAHGHQNIAFVSGYDTIGSDSEARLNGYREGLAQHGLPYDPDLVTSGLHAPGPGYEATCELLRRGKPFTAIIASNDDSAVGVLEALRASGKIVPQDIAVIGFDDRPEARAQIPLLTTVHHPMFELGSASFELLYQIMKGEAPRDTQVRIPTHLVIRETCGCLPGEASSHSNSDGVYQSTSASSSNAISITTPSTSIAHGEIPANLERVAQAMAENTFKEMQRLSRSEVDYLCYRLLDAFILSLKHGNTADFHHAVQQILEHVAWEGDDLYAWQSAITVLKEMYPDMLDTLPYTLPAAQMENMLHQARIAISEVSRGQYSRLLVRQAAVASDIGRMTANFFAAHDEAQVFQILKESLASLGIMNAVVMDFLPDRADPIGSSRVRWPDPVQPVPPVFDTKSFPPPGLYPDDRAHQLSLLPLVGLEGQTGYVVFEASDMSSLGTITQQLTSALRSVNLYRQIDEARVLAEDARQLAEQARHTAEEARCMEEEARRSAEKARQSAEEARLLAEDANQMKSRFLSIVSHELRTPLNLIFGLSNIMLEESKVTDGEQCLVDRKDLERVYIGAQHLESLIRDVLDLARTDIGQLKLTYEPLNLNEVLNAVANIGEHLSRDKELVWQTEISPTLPLVRGDRTRLRQVILNLINNAIKFTIRGSVTLTAQAENGHITISVRDTGLGIPQDEQMAIFDEFHQSKRTTARGFGGLGLGLAICKRLVEMHNGQIAVSSAGGEGSGSTFSVCLPVIEEAAPDSASCASVAGPRVLLLVNEEPAAIVLEKHLARQGFQIDTHVLETSEDWTAWLNAAPPDRIILDRDTAGRHGWEIMKAVSENPATHGTPILFYTLDQENDHGALLDLNYLTKPLQTSDLAEALVSRGLADELANRGSGRPILIVDDDPAILDLHTRTVQALSSSYRILQASNGREALERIYEERPVLVLLDLMMPELDGFGVLDAMQQDERLRGITVIVLTSQALTEEDMMRLNGSAAAVLGKGMFTRQETLAHITAALSRKRRPGLESQRVVTKAMAFIHQNYVEPITRGEIAAHVGLSERHLTRCFNQEMGITPMTYLNRFRVRQAKMMLQQGEKCITDIAMQVGFSTSGYFARVFKDEVGMTPRAYLQDQTGDSENCG